MGDTILLGNERLTIAGLLTHDPFSEDGLAGERVTLMASDETFTRLTGISGYALVLIQATAGISDEEVAAIRQVAEENGYTPRDKRDQRTSGTCFAFAACGYAFLGIIALVAVLNIVNSIWMSASSRITLYGSMRAVGMDGGQLSQMIRAEAFTYAVSGCAAGCAMGLPLSKMIYGFLITGHFLIPGACPWGRWPSSSCLSSPRRNWPRMSRPNGCGPSG